MPCVDSLQTGHTLGITASNLDKQEFNTLQYRDLNCANITQYEVAHTLRLQ